MISISTKIDRGGFWYLVDAANDSTFTLSYIVIGTGGRQGSGEIDGIASSSGDWRFVEVAFPVLHVGITDLRVKPNSPYDEIAREYSPQADLLSRRRSIKTIAGMLLAGWTMLMLPLGVAQGQTPRIGSRPLTGEDPDDNGFNPSSSRFNPYASDRNMFFGSR